MDNDEVTSTHGPTCPNCGTVIDPETDRYFDEMKYTEDLCEECGWEFQVSVYTETTWTTEKKRFRRDTLEQKDDVNGNR